MENPPRKLSELSGSEWVESIKDWAEGLGNSATVVAEPKTPSVTNFFHTSPSASADGKVSLAKRAGQNWSMLNGEQKANAVMWGAGALLGAFGMVNAAQGAIRRDDDGMAHLNWSNVGVTLLQATLAVGCAFAGIHALQAQTLR